LKPDISEEEDFIFMMDEVEFIMDDLEDFYNYLYTNPIQCRLENLVAKYYVG